VPKRFLACIMLLMAVRIILDLAYVYCMVPEFGYEGFTLSINVWHYFLSWAFYILVFPMASTRLRNVSDAVFMLVISSIVAPLTSMYGLSDKSIVPVILAIFSLGMIYIILKTSQFHVPRISYFKDGERAAKILSLFVILVVVVHYILSGVHFNLSLLKVYDFRSENTEIAAKGAFAYLNPWAYEVFNLFLIAVFLMRKKYILVFVCFVIQIFFFAASQHKSVFFAPFFILGVWWYLRRSDNLLIIPLSIFALIFISLSLYVFWGNSTLPSLAIRRIFFVPSGLDFDYYNFFSSHPKVVWGDTFWMPFMHNPYGATIPYVIGRFLGDPDMAANNGYVSSGFAQAGVFGVFIYTLVVGYALKFVDHESRSLSAVWFGVGLFLLPFLTIWLSSDLATSLLTHGFLVMLVLLALLRRPARYLAGQPSTDTAAARSMRKRHEIGSNFPQELP
jgi:O-antigen polymerase